MASENQIQEIIAKLSDALAVEPNLLKAIQDNASLANEKLQKPGHQLPKDLGAFYLYVGGTAMSEKVTVLTPDQMKNSLGFSEMVSLLRETVQEVPDYQSLVGTVDDSAAFYGAVYSTQSLTDYSGDINAHIADDIQSIYHRVVQPPRNEKNAEKNIKAYYEEMGDDARFRYQDMLERVVSFLSEIYQNTYQIVTPKGVLIPNMDDPKQAKYGLIGITPKRKGRPPRVDFQTGSKILYRQLASIMSQDLNLSDVEVNLDDEYFSLKTILTADKNKRVFFVKPHLRLLFGRNLFVRQSKGQPSNRWTIGERKYRVWAEAKESLTQFVENTFRDAVIHQIKAHINEWYDIDEEDNRLADFIDQVYMDNTTGDQKAQALNAIEDSLNSDFKRVAQSIMTTFVLSEFGGSEDSPSKIAFRGSFHANDVTAEQLFTELSQKVSSITITEEEKLAFTPRLDLTHSETNDLLAYHYEHTFNASRANAIPLFAAKALDYIQKENKYHQSKNPTQKQIPPVSWKNLLVGMDTNGNIEQGQDHVQLRSHILHYLSAGSRSGKGVASYNLILPQLLEDRLFFYADRKPDTSVVLAQHAGTDAQHRPKLALVNGGQRDALAPENGWVIEWEDQAIQKHLPSFFEPEFRVKEVLADFVYLRQCLLVLALIDAFVKVGNEKIMETLDLPGNFASGISAVFDEYTNYQTMFLERLSPYASNGSLLKDIVTEDAYEVIADKDSKMYKDYVDKKGLDKRMTLMNTWKLSIAMAVVDSKGEMEMLKNAGIKNRTNDFDILVIGQGIRGKKTKSEFAFDKAGNGITFNKGGLGAINAQEKTKDMLTTLIDSIPERDYLFGKPPEPQPGQDYDPIRAAGSNRDVYGKYLSQDYRGFAYITDDQLNNDPRQGYIFKPFLLLNEGSEPDTMKAMAKEGKNDPQIIDDAQRRLNNKAGGYLAFLAQNVNNIKGTDWLSVRNEVKDALHLDEPGESLAGVIPYANAIGFDNSKYAKTITFMNALVEKMGYDGDYYDFICDLRPEWLFGVKDITTLLEGGQEAFRHRDTLRFFRAYAKYESAEGLDTQLLGITDDSMPVENDESMRTEPNEEESLESVGITADDNEPNTNGSSQSLGNDSLDRFDVPPEEPNISTAGFVPHIAKSVSGMEDVANDVSDIPETFHPVSDIDDTPEAQQMKNQAEDVDDIRKDEESLRSAEESEYYYMGMGDSLSGKLAYSSMSEIQLETIKMKGPYDKGYRQGFKRSTQRGRINYLLSHQYPEAKATEALVGNMTEESVLRKLDELDDQEVKSSHLSDSKDVLNDMLVRYLPAGVQQRISQRYRTSLSQDAIEAYGEENTYVLNGQMGTVTALDQAVTIPYEPMHDPETGKVDDELTLSTYIQKATEQIINRVGSYRQFKDITVTTDGQMIINHMLRLQFAVPKAEYDRLPWGVKYVIDHQEWAKLFSWHEVLQMPELVSLSFESTSFILSYVRAYFDWKPEQMVDQRLLLMTFPQLYEATIGDHTVTRRELLKDVPADESIEEMEELPILTSQTPYQKFQGYATHAFDKVKHKAKDEYQKDWDTIKATKAMRRQRYDEDYADFVNAAETRQERRIRKRMAKGQMSGEGMRDAMASHNFRRIVTEAGFGLMVIPGVMLAHYQLKKRQRKGKKEK